MALMEREFHRKLRLGELATAAGLSVSRLCHLFKKDTGSSPARYLKLARLKRAKELIEKSSLSVKEVTVAVGLDSVSHLVQGFKQHYGATPLRHRFRSFEIAP